MKLDKIEHQLSLLDPRQAQVETKIEINDNKIKETKSLQWLSKKNDLGLLHHCVHCMFETLFQSKDM